MGNSNVVVGSKYYRYDKDGNREVFRVASPYMDDGDEVVHVIRENTDDLMYISKKEFDSLIQIIPDAKLDLMITQYEDPEKKDVYAWVYRTDVIAEGRSDPSLMLRQDVYSQAKNAFGTDGVAWVGECLTDQTNPTHVPLKSLAEFNEVELSYPISLYITDSIEDIINCIDTDTLGRYDSVLKKLTKYNSNEIKGYCSTLRELMEENGFIGYFRSIFNVTQVDWALSGKTDDNGDLQFTEDEFNKFQDLIRKYISNVKIIEYDRDIDIHELVNTPHAMIADSNDKIYLVVYDIVSDYKTEIDDDIMKAFGLQTASKEDIEAQLGVKL